MTPACLLLYDQHCRIVWLNWAEPPYTPADFIGHYAWARLHPPEDIRLQAAMGRCLASESPQFVDIRVPKVGLWRIWLWHISGLQVIRMAGMARKFPSQIEALTDRERAVCTLIGSGLNSKQIASRLRITLSTVNNHRAHIAGRLGISTAALPAWCGNNLDWLPVSSSRM